MTEITATQEGHTWQPQELLREEATAAPIDVMAESLAGHLALLGIHVDEDIAKMDMTQLRGIVDGCDDIIVNAIFARQIATTLIGHVKKQTNTSTLDLTRERAVFNRVNPGQFGSRVGGAVTDLYLALFAASKQSHAKIRYAKTED